MTMMKIMTMMMDTNRFKELSWKLAIFKFNKDYLRKKVFGFGHYLILKNVIISV